MMNVIHLMNLCKLHCLSDRGLYAEIDIFDLNVVFLLINIFGCANELSMFRVFKASTSNLNMLLKKAACHLAILLNI